MVLLIQSQVSKMRCSFTQMPTTVSFAVWPQRFRLVPLS
jgi:hypothetical protein